MKYTILIYESEADFGARTAGARKDAYGGAYRAYTQALTEAGVMVGGALPGRLDGRRRGSAQSAHGGGPCQGPPRDQCACRKGIRKTRR